MSQQLRAALLTKGKDYQPRTRHQNEDGSPRYINQLIFEDSPYLLQHAHNPVSWSSWSEEAFERARREDKPVLVSIGYSTCHWCHVMEHESFEDEEIARFLNDHFVAIKVDREERPDVDDVYMAAVTLLSGRGGWPMTVVMTPDQQPFFGGTYFPARDGDRGPGPGFLTILQELARLYRTDRADLLEHAAEVRQRILRGTAPAGAHELPDADAVETAVARQLAMFDPLHGGFGAAPKFPRPVTLQLLMRYHRRSGDERARVAVERTLEKMHAGGIYDHVGGGFHRYSTDARWLVPHFEKMLYDNAQLAVAYLEGWQLTGKAEYARVVRQVLDSIDREMGDERGGFHSATDADSKAPDGHDEEGWYFTWTRAELDAALAADDAELVASYFGVVQGGNFEGRSVLHLPRTHEHAAEALKLTPAALRAAIDAACERLRAARTQRPKPLKDDKVLTSWNGLAISAFARAGFALDEPRYLERAARAADFLRSHHRAADGALLRSSRAGAAHIGGFLDDHAFLIAGLLDLYEATGQVRWLTGAIELQARQDTGFHDDDTGGYFMTNATHEAPLLRLKPDYDGAEPSGNSVAALNLLRLSELTLDESLRTRALGTIRALARHLDGAPLLLCALDFALDDAKEIVIVAADRQAAAPLLDAVRSTFLPNRVLVVSTGEAPAPAAMAAGKIAIDGAATAYLCRRGACELPVQDPAALRRQLASIKPLR